MDELRLLNVAVSEEESALQQLHHWLSYETLTVILGGGMFFLSYGLAMTVLIVLAVLFTPYMLWQLARAKWLKAIVAFAVVVIVPFALSRWMHAEGSVGYYVWTMGPLVLFYLYAWVLRYVIGEHLSEMQMVRQVESGRRRNDA